jgi:hypothetical protein
MGTVRCFVPVPADDSPRCPRAPGVSGRRTARWAVLALLAIAAACSPGAPTLCAQGLADGGCSYHVEVHCGSEQVCSAGSFQVLDAGACVRDKAADVIGCL